MLPVMSFIRSLLVKDKLNVSAVKFHQPRFHQLRGVIVPGNADGLPDAAYGFCQQVHDLVQHIPVNPLGVLAKVFILDELRWFFLRRLFSTVLFRLS